MQTSVSREKMGNFSSAQPFSQRNPFPYPDFSACSAEIADDPLCGKIPEADREFFCARAWKIGTETARMIFREQKSTGDFYRICRGANLKIMHRNIDCRVGDKRFFSEYISGKKEIILNDVSLALWASHNGVDVSRAQNMALSHEFFHFLEWTRLGLISKKHDIPFMRIGPWKVGRAMLRSLSEIGAYGFTREYFDLLSSTNPVESSNF